MSTYPPRRVVLQATGGMFTDLPDMKFIQYGGQTFYNWVAGASGDVKLAAHSDDGETSAFVAHAALGGTLGNPDLHDSGAFLVRDSDQRLLFAYCAHHDTTIRLRISTNPLDATAWGAEASLDASLGGADYTYCGLTQLLGEASDPIYLFYRDISGTDGRLCFSKSTDGGVTWAAQTVLFTPTSGEYSYRRIATDRDTRIDFFVTDTSRTLLAPSKLGHFYYDGTYHASDGTGLGAPPFAMADITVIKDTTNGPVSACQAGYDAAGNPVVLLMTYDASTAKIWQARWTGSAWSVVEIGSQAGLGGGSNPFVLGAAMALDDVNRVWFPVKVGSHFERFAWSTADDGATWTGAQATFDSGADHMLPSAVQDTDQRLQVIESVGSHSDDFTFTAAVEGGY